MEMAHIHLNGFSIIRTQWILLLLLIGFSSLLYAIPDQSKPDIARLIKQSELETDIHKKIQQYIEICWQCRYIDPRTGLSYGKKALMLENQSGFIKYKPKTLNLIGLSYLQLKKYNQAQNYYFKAVKMATEIDDAQQLAYAFQNINYLYQLLGKYLKAYDITYEAVALFRKRNHQRGLAYSLHNLGKLEFRFKKYREALKNFNEAYRIREIMDDSAGMVESLQQIAAVHFRTGQYDLALEKYRELEKTVDPKKHKYLYANILSGIGDVYYRKGQFDLAMQYKSEAMKRYIETVANDKIIDHHISIGKIYLSRSEYDRAEESIAKAYALARQDQLKNHQLDALAAYIELYRTRGDFKTAFSKYETYIQLKEKIFDETKKQQIESLRIEYDFKNKERKIQILKNETEIKDLQKNLLLLSLILGTILFFFILIRSIQKSKMNRLLTKQKQDLETAYRELKEMNTKLVKLERKNTAMAMAVTTNHELNQPLTVLQGNFELLMKRVDNDLFSIKERAYIDKINRSIERISAILNKYRESDTFSVDAYDEARQMLVFKEDPESPDREKTP